MKKAVGYISSKKHNDIEREIEIKVQKERISDYCKQNDFELSNLYVEPKESTEDYKSEIFKLLDDAGNNLFQEVIVLSIERVGTDSVAKKWFVDELKKRGVRVQSLSEDLNLSANTDDEFLNKAEKIKNRVKDLPSLPEIVNKVIALIQNPNSSASQLAKVISNDAGLTARVLRLVNSAYYGFPKQISSIQHSIAILGFTSIKGLVLSSSIFRVFAPKNDGARLLDYKKLWKHSLICAVIAKNINKLLKKFEEDNIFSAAILHDMGKIILDQYDHPNYTLALANTSKTDFYNYLKTEAEYCGLNHCEVGYLISTHWNLPENISQTIRFHHTPNDAGEEYQGFVNLISLANIFTHTIEEDIALEEKYLKDVDLYTLGLDINSAFDLFPYIKDKVEEEKDLESFFD